MPGKVKVKIIAGRNLPVMDRSSDTTDAYVEIKLGNTSYKTDVCRKSLNPQWNSEWFRFDMDDAELQDEPLQIRLMDHDTYTANDFIGKVYIDLNPLLLVPTTAVSMGRPGSAAGAPVMAGWIPVFDTINGIRGEVNIVVKLELFTDFNKFRQSSCGVQFFCSTVTPHGYLCQMIHGFVEELVVNNDPEYQWIDKIRTPRASNEARQTLFFKISGEIQRKIGIKALDLGANSVIGYSQNFDLEGESGVVARGTGTAVTLIRIPDPYSQIQFAKDGVSNKANLAPRIAVKFPYKFALKKSPHTPVTVASSARHYNRSYSADRGRAHPVLHRGQSTHSLKLDQLKSSRLHKGGSTGSLKNDLGSRAVRILRSILPGRASQDDIASVEEGSVRILRTFLPGRRRQDEELACVEEGSVSSSSSSGSPKVASCAPVPSVHERYIETLPVECYVSRSISPSSVSSSSSTSCSSLGRETPLGSVLEEDDSVADDNVSAVLLPSNEDLIPDALPTASDVNNIAAQTFFLANADDSVPENSEIIEPSTAPLDNFRTSVFLFPKSQAVTERPVSEARNIPNSRPPTPIIKIQPETPTSSFGESQKLSLPPLIQIQPSTPSGSSLHISSESADGPVAAKARHSLPTKYLGACPNLHKSQSVSALVSHACAPMCRETDDVALGGEAADGGTPRSAATASTSGASGVLKSPALPIHRRSSESDLSAAPKVSGSVSGSERSCGHRNQLYAIHRPVLNQDSIELLEYPFLTMSRYPPGLLLSLGGTVSARSVKLLERMSNLEEPEARDAWWQEIRMEVRSHARALGCNVIVGYTETTSICDDVCVLSAAGTAAVINMNQSDDVFTSEGNGDETKCGLCHVPYSVTGLPFRVNLHTCAVCKKGKVPDVLFSTIDLVDMVPSTGKGSLIHAHVARPKRECKGEMNAKEISDGLPFLEYDLNRLLMSKLKVKGMNAILGLKVQISVGEKMLIGLATGTATLLTALPVSGPPTLTAGNSWRDSQKLAEIQKLLTDTYLKNIEFYNLRPDKKENKEPEGAESVDVEAISNDLPQLDLAAGNRDACILEVDDAEDVDRVCLLTDPQPPAGFHVVCTEGVPSVKNSDVIRNLQMFTNVWRSKIPYGQPLSTYNLSINRIIQGILFKLRNTHPAALSGLSMKVQLEQDEVQVSAVGMALGLADQQPSEAATPALNSRKHVSPKSRYGVDITPLSYVAGGTIERYLGNLNFFFIRESSSIREGGGLSGFVHNFLMEVLAVVRAHVTALGGNAMVSYFMSECFLYNYPHKNQGQCLINVGGDVVYVSYFPTEPKS